MLLLGRQNLLPEMDQKSLFDGIIGCGDSDFVFVYPKVFKLHAILHHATQEKRSLTG